MNWGGGGKAAPHLSAHAVSINLGLMILSPVTGVKKRPFEPIAVVCLKTSCVGVCPRSVTTARSTLYLRYSTYCCRKLQKLTEPELKYPRFDLKSRSCRKNVFQFVTLNQMVTFLLLKIRIRMLLVSQLEIVLNCKQNEPPVLPLSPTKNDAVKASGWTSQVLTASLTCNERSEGAVSGVTVLKKQPTSRVLFHRSSSTKCECWNLIKLQSFEKFGTNCMSRIV